jgi:hypothetical protein
MQPLASLRVRWYATHWQQLPRLVQDMSVHLQSSPVLVHDM